MTNVEKVMEYLDKANIFYVATVDGGKPKCRPFSFKIAYNGKIYFGAGTFKAVYQQMQDNPQVEICASDGKGFLRYYGQAAFVDDPALLEEAFKIAPYLRGMYNEKTGRTLRMFYLADATAEFRDLMTVKESLKL